MSILEPGDEPIEDAIIAVEEVATESATPAPSTPAVVERAFKDVCKHCLRPVMQDDRPESATGYLHWDPRIDQPSNRAFHLAELYEPGPTRWGFLVDDRKSQFEVSQGPSKVRPGWSGGGVA